MHELDSPGLCMTLMCSFMLWSKIGKISLIPL
jgi:hypothetical protein